MSPPKPCRSCDFGNTIAHNQAALSAGNRIAAQTSASPSPSASESPAASSEARSPAAPQNLGAASASTSAMRETAIPRAQRDRFEGAPTTALSPHLENPALHEKASPSAFLPFRWEAGDSLQARPSSEKSLSSASELSPQKEPTRSNQGAISRSSLSSPPSSVARSDSLSGDAAAPKTNVPSETSNSSPTKTAASGASSFPVGESSSKPSLSPESSLPAGGAGISLSKNGVSLPRTPTGSAPAFNALSGLSSAAEFAPLLRSVLGVDLKTILANRPAPPSKAAPQELPVLKIAATVIALPWASASGRGPGIFQRLERSLLNFLKLFERSAAEEWKTCETEEGILEKLALLWKLKEEENKRKTRLFGKNKEGAPVVGPCQEGEADSEDSSRHPEENAEKAGATSLLKGQQTESSANTSALNPIEGIL